MARIFLYIAKISARLMLTIQVTNNEIFVMWASVTSLIKNWLTGNDNGMNWKSYLVNHMLNWKINDLSVLLLRCFHTRYPYNLHILKLCFSYRYGLIRFTISNFSTSFMMCMHSSVMRMLIRRLWNNVMSFFALLSAFSLFCFGFDSKTIL